MEKRKLKKEVVYTSCALVIILLISLLYYTFFSNTKLSNDKEDYTYVSKLFGDNVKKVVSTPKLIMRPFNNADVKVLKNFYDYKADESTQENSIINYDTTYIQNNGVIFGGPQESFEVTSILDGKVTSVKDDKLLGKIVTIKHENEIESTYQCLSEVTVKENDEVSQGTVIGKAGTSNLEKDLGPHILLEITKDGKSINPLNAIDKQINDIKSE
ncbi:MAG: M23 family metallopeptidase [Bacilli bacterium]|nr:M23 family metallopeptidase [Bacilli bacterium]